MSSAFFRRPEGSSSSKSDESGEAEPSHQQEDDIIEGEGETFGTESLSSRGSISLRDGQDATPATFASVDHHRTNLLCALLEDFARNRASEMMSNAKPGYHFSKSSAEVQPLARKLYQQVGRSLALNGILPPSSTNDSQSSQHTRATYLAGIESLALGTMPNNELLGHARSQLPARDEHLAVARVNQPQNPLVRFPQHQTRTRFSSPYSDLVLSPPVRRSHYESSFQQIKLLGKGGFGKVYHTYNLFDKKEYAVKKIPLSPRLSRRYRESGHQELESVLREVQALAQLEHNNVVRYHATWMEEPRDTPPDIQFQPRKHSLTVQGRKLLAEGPMGPGPTTRRLLGQRQVPPEYSDGIVFGSDSVSHATSEEVENDAEQSVSAKCSDWETPSARTSEIFTDGYARPNVEGVTTDDSVYVLHVQMSIYPMTLAQYLAPPSGASRSAPSSPARRHCFHLVPSVRILMSILSGLQYIHAKGLVHRDIKPSNIFISSLGILGEGPIPEAYHDVGACVGCPDPRPYFVNPRIGDFGLVAELAEINQFETSNTESANTKAVGTEFYRPPPWNDSKARRKSRSSVDEKIDVFALGVVLVEMLWYCTTSTERLHVLRDLQLGRLPAGLAEKIDNEGHEPGVGSLVSQCIIGMIERNPRRRWGCTQVKEWAEMILTRCKAPMVANGSGGKIDAGRKEYHRES
ncbi:uncharacterized protein Z518_05318 [Rhinocladiella mackenziei CBS 650.93]|uniref:Protein kinase domain-containing protein n=1 Tax=Rhinocladiella mackenziei CBS 650.93 TaxID=1442369 RepID=A0A0D2J5X9_9EURO|nr:uncharacterized protein Z518_05318 [Rhinocladiella mackenziei CBS 650.93]KIX04450.1 hypothetical protein Z518_05318 [Rhinocladiella mackenziei CBS 650.93]